MLDDDNAVGFDDDDASLAGFDLGDDAGFGDGGEVWAREAALEPMLKVHRVEDGEGNLDGEEPDQDAYTISLSHQPGSQDHDNILRRTGQVRNTGKFDASKNMRLRAQPMPHQSSAKRRSPSRLILPRLWTRLLLKRYIPRPVRVRPSLYPRHNGKLKVAISFLMTSTSTPDSYFVCFSSPRLGWARRS